MICVTAKPIRNSDSVSCTSSDDTANTRASVGWAGRLISVDSAVIVVAAASVKIQRVEPITGVRGTAARYLKSPVRSAFHPDHLACTQDSM
jgi:hypothetical protein